MDAYPRPRCSSACWSRCSPTAGPPLPPRHLLPDPRRAARSTDEALRAAVAADDRTARDPRTSLPPDRVRHAAPDGAPRRRGAGHRSTTCARSTRRRGPARWREFFAAERADLFDPAVPPLLRGWPCIWRSPAVMAPGLHPAARADPGVEHSSRCSPSWWRCTGSYRAGEQPAAYEAPSVRFADFVAGELESLDPPRRTSGYWRGRCRAAHPGHGVPAGWGADGPGRPHVRGARSPLGDLEQSRCAPSRPARRCR